MVLNLVYPDKSDIPYKIVKFSDSQIQFTLEDPYQVYNANVTIYSRMSWGDVQVIIAAQAALQEAGVELTHLWVPYFLGGRSDRKFSEGSVNYIKSVITPIINDLEFDSVSVLDPHSDVLEACLNVYVKEDNVPLVQWALRDLYPDLYLPELDKRIVLVSPDAGALKKIYNVAEKICYNGDIIVASKHRDIKTGKILSTEVPLCNEYDGKDFIICDDIIDGGRTFIEIAKKIKETFADAKIYLIVTHGIFSAGLYELSKYFTKVYCTNSVKDIEPESYSDYTVEKSFLKQLNVFE